MLVEPPWKGRTGEDPNLALITELFAVCFFFPHNYVFVHISWKTCRMHRRCYQMDQSSQCCQRAIFEASLSLIEALGRFLVLPWPEEAAGARTSKGRAAFPGNSMKTRQREKLFYWNPVACGSFRGLCMCRAQPGTAQTIAKASRHSQTKHK